MCNYDRCIGIGAQLLQPLSPNIQNIQSCYGYSFLGLLGEIKPFDVGVGTPYAFQCISLPKDHSIKPIVWKNLQNLFVKQGIQTSYYTYFSERKNTTYSGLRLYFPDEMADIHAFPLFIAVLDYFKKNGVQIKFSPTFNKAVGIKEIQEWFMEKTDRTVTLQTININLQQFYKKAQSSFLYEQVLQVGKIE